MPRFSFGYKLGEKNVIKGGYGIYYDTLNARDWTPNQDGYDVTTTNQLSNDFGQTFAAGRSAERHPAAGRSVPGARATAAGTRSFPGTRSAPTTCSGRGFTAENPDRVHSRVQRWRAGLAARTRQPHGDRGRLLPARTPTGRGSPSARTILPEQYWSSANVRDTSANDFLTANVTNPFNIANFAVAADDATRCSTQRLAGIDVLHVDRPSRATVCCGRSRT